MVVDLFSCCLVIDMVVALVVVVLFIHDMVNCPVCYCFHNLMLSC